LGRTTKIIWGTLVGSFPASKAGTIPPPAEDAALFVTLKYVGTNDYRKILIHDVSSGDSTDAVEIGLEITRI
jgi:hypothetical protein